MAIRTILIDVNAYTAFKKGQPEAVEIIKHARHILLNPVILAELLSGFRVGKKSEKNRRELDLFLESKRVNLVEINSSTAEYYSEIYKELRQMGKPIPTNDIWIAATAKQYQTAIFTYDKHFSYIMDLEIVSKLEDL